MRVVAEGVESEQVLDLLASVHCDFAQGFYISRPVLPDGVTAWFAQSGFRTVIGCGDA
jgi:EAL domain-containing protein (putative c-di-GMP-specific phosphodiesterase class I)